MQRDGRFLGWIPSTSTNLIVVERALAGRTEKGAAQSSHFAAAPVFWGDSLKYRTSLPAVVMLTKETGVGSLS